MRSANLLRELSLTIAAALSFAVAALHLGIVFVGAPGYSYFGAPDLGHLALQGSAVPAILTLCLVGIFCLFGLYAISGAGRFRRLPFLPVALVLIAAVYTMRGLVLPLEVYTLVQGNAPFPPRYAVFSATSLLIGVLYLIGTAQAWRRLWTGSSARHRVAGDARSGTGAMSSQ